MSCTFVTVRAALTQKREYDTATRVFLNPIPSFQSQKVHFNVAWRKGLVPEDLCHGFFMRETIFFSLPRSVRSVAAFPVHQKPKNQQTTWTFYDVFNKACAPRI